MNIRESEEFKSGFSKIVTCPICGEKTLDMYWICENCFWEYDGACAEEDYSCANGSTVRDYRKAFLEGQKQQ